MKVSLKVNELVFEIDGDCQKVVWDKIAEIQEVFSEKKCGVCGNPEIKYAVREVDNNKFYELQCQNPKCRARKSYGQHKNQKTLFPHRKDDNGEYLKQNGWAVYIPPKVQ